MSNFSAVLVGINKYEQSPLRGCVNDVEIMRDILVDKYGIPAKQIRLVLDDRATKEGILDRLSWLANNSTENKLFHYSGHGAQVPNQPYDNEDYEPDGMDEILCPVDMNWDGTYIRDDQIDSILEEMREGHHMSMVFDCCHSGTIDRDMRFGKPQPPKTRQLEAPKDIQSRMSANKLSGDVVLRPDQIELKMTSKQGSSKFDLNDEFFSFFEKQSKSKAPTRKPNRSKHNVSVLTGCKDEQTSADAWVGNRHQGALSFVAQGILLQNPEISLKQLREQAVTKLEKYGFPQTPQLSCSEKNYEKRFIQI